MNVSKSLTWVSVDFLSYFWGTLFGFLPGTVAYVYTGEIGKVLTLGAGEAQPWYVYAGALGILAGTISILGNIASKVGLWFTFIYI